MYPIFPRALTGLLSCLLLAACGERITGIPAADAAQQYAYFPLRIGQYAVFSVDSVVYDFGPGGETLRDSTHTFLKEMVTDTLRDNTGALLFTIERYERNADTLPWTLKNIWTAARNSSQAIRTEDNLRFLKLVFPMDQRTEWNGNLWIDPDREIEIAGESIRPFSNWHYEVDSIDVPGNIGVFTFDSVLTVTEADDINIIERRLSRAKYAKNVGLVWREQWILDSQYCNQDPVPADCTTKPWEEKAEKGYILKQTIIEYN